LESDDDFFPNSVESLIGGFEESDLRERRFPSLTSSVTSYKFESESESPFCTGSFSSTLTSTLTSGSLVGSSFAGRTSADTRDLRSSTFFGGESPLNITGPSVAKSSLGSPLAMTS